MTNWKNKTLNKIRKGQQGFKLVGYRDNKPLYTNGTIDTSTGSPMLFDENYNPLSGKTFVYNLPAAEKTSTRKAQESAIKLRNPLAEATPEQVLSASTLGADKWIQPSWYVGMIRRSSQGKDATQDFIYGNTGVFNEGYAEKHPYVTTAANLVTDIAVPGAVVLKTKIKFPYKSNLTGRGAHPSETPLGVNTNLYPDFSKLTRSEKIQWLKTQQELAQRVDQARNLDALRLTKDRLRKGGVDRIKNAFLNDKVGINEESNIVPMDKNTKLYIYRQILNPKALSEKPVKGTASDITKELRNRGYEGTLFPEDGGIGGTGLGYSDVPRNSPQEFSAIRKGLKGAAHEFAHYFYWPISRPKGIHFFGRSAQYLSGQEVGAGSGEIAARGTQLKNYFGLKEGEKLTPVMWDYAKRHYSSDVGTNLEDLFRMVNTKSPEYPLFIKWINKHAPILTTGITVTGALNSINNE